MFSIPEYIVEPFREKIEIALNELVKHAEEICIDSVWLFGSLARNDYRYNSDIDLLVMVRENPRRASRKIEDLDIDDINFPSIDFVVKTPESLESDVYLFNDYVKRDRILLWRYKNEF